MFIVRDDASHSDLLFKTSDTTWEAYNRYGGSSLYYTNTAGRNRAYKVSYNRPFNTRQYEPLSWVFGEEYPMVKWLERNGYDVSYFTSLDTDRYGSLLQNHKVVLSVGHDEYWSGGERANIEAARNAGVNLAFFSGNEMFWKTRWENSIDGSNTPYRTLVCYKETHDNAKTDPSPEWTGTWRDPRFSPHADGGRPENAVTGTIFMVDNYRNDPIEVPAVYGKMRFWRNTDIANLAPGETATLPDGVLGYEWDEDLDNGFRPAGLIDMSSTTRQVSSYLLDYGTIEGNATATHHLTLYRARSGALVFGAGTVQWAWGLDDDHDRADTPTDSRMQQATVNLFADMGVQPATLQSNLVPATASTDTTAPKSTITSPADGSKITTGTQVTITGTATDSGGGVVGGVEISVDGGTTWHPVSGREQWSYTWNPSSTGTYNIKTRATDDSANLEVPSAGVNVTIAPRPCPCSLWNDTVTPTVTSAADDTPYELGVKFSSEEDGYVTGVRFYKGSQNTGTHVGHLWDSAGNMLAEATFTDETASGWQHVSFDKPVPVTANTTYVVSYHTNTGHFAVDRPYFGKAYNNSPLHALADGADGPNGVYKAGDSGFPTGSYLSGNYWVDVVFVTTLEPDTTPPTISLVGPAPDTTNIPAGTKITATFSEPMALATISSNTFQLRDESGALVPATVTYDTGTYTAILTPSVGLTRSTRFTATVKGGSGGAKDQAYNDLAADYSWSFTVTSLNNIPVVGSPEGQGNPVTAEGQTVDFEIEASDADRDKLTFSATGLPPNLSIDPNTGDISGVIASGASANSPYSVTVNASDGIDTGSTNFSWRITAADQAPAVTNPGDQTNNEGQAVNLQIQATDAENDPLTYSATGLPTGLSINTRTGAISGTVPVNAAANSPYTVKVTASDGLKTGSATFTWTVLAGRSCPCSLWDDSTTPSVTSSPDNGPIEVGVKFNSDVAGYITGVRFYKGDQNTGTHVGHLWDDSGNLLATATFNSETASGWQQVRFPRPVPINPGITYVASYHTNTGHFAVDRPYFGARYTNSPLHALASATDGGNGVYKPGDSGFPTSSYSASNYWVDVVFATNIPPDTMPPTVLSVKPADGTTGAGIEGKVTATFSEAMDSTTVNANTFQLRDADNAIVPATLSYDIDNSTATLTPSAPLQPGAEYTVTISGGSAGMKDLAENPLVSDYTWSFTVKSCPCSLWDDSTTPTLESSNDPGAIELGVKFRSDVDGYVTGVRFYKSTQNTGTHLGHLWDSSGNMLAEATFTNESASGWQQVYFDKPVSIKAGTTYVASYHTDTGYFAVDRPYFGNAYDNSPLHATADATDDPNGVYKPGASGFPAATYLSSNYWVDVTFTTVKPPSTSITSGPSDVSGSTSASFEFTSDQDGSTFECKLDSGTFGTCTSPKTYTGLSEGSHTFSVRATDADGNTDPGPASRTWTVDLTPPDAPVITAPDNNSVTNTGSVTVSGTAEPSSTVELFDGSTSVGTTTAATDDGQWSKTLSGVADGSHTYTAKATDPAGHTSVSSNARTVIVDTTAPAKPPVNLVAGSDTGASNTDDLTSDNTPTLDGNAAAGSQIKVYDTFGGNRTPLGTATADRSGYWTLTSAALDDGVHSISATATDPAGNTSAESDALKVTVDTTAPKVSDVAPADQATGVSFTGDVTATFSEDVDPDTLTSSSFTLTKQGGTTPISGNVTHTASSVTLSPTAPLDDGATYTATVKTGVKDLAGNALAADKAWTFTVRACPCSLWDDSATPATASSNDPGAIEVGVKFRSDVDGYITGIRFYKGDQNTGTHVGHLWDASGNLLATATFTNETASGWQQVSFDTPVSIKANTTYVASYHTNTGYFAVTRPYFVNARVSSPLRAPVNSADEPNGVYKPGDSGFPTSSYSASNYWVDVIFSTTAP